MKLQWAGGSRRKTSEDTSGMVTSVNLAAGGALVGVSEHDDGDPGTASRVRGGGPAALVEGREGVNALVTRIEEAPLKESKLGRYRMNRT
ncbi:MAG: hypothetical protein JRI25_01355 [Deltaproteobacteria bacterium]|nr:hypothetical protein [Deltaproteobacteria bacterium]MBW2253226.1 hypothetical protein [Deltaproteobacteria bacterium]